jgi:hypothetical protein
MKAPQDSLIPLEAFVFVRNGKKLPWIYFPSLINNPSQKVPTYHSAMRMASFDILIS